MSAFAHLCRECLDVPSTQCGYRHCPARLGAASVLPGAASTNADATRAVAPTVPPSNPNDALMTRFAAGAAPPTAAVPNPALPAAAPYAVPAAPPAAAGDALQTRWVESARSAPSVGPVAPPVAQPANSDALSTRYVSPTTEIKR